jgi:hypothetical protein
LLARLHRYTAERLRREIELLFEDRHDTEILLSYARPRAIRVGDRSRILEVRMRSSTLVAGLWLSLFIVGDVQAYLDPGAGSIVLQAIIAAVAGGFIVMRTYWSTVKQLFTRRKTLRVAEANPQPRD